MEKLLTYCQTKLNISRRKFTDIVDDWTIFLNWKIVESYSIKVKDWDEIYFSDKKDNKIIVKLQDDEKTIMIWLNKPVWYTVAKTDKFNKTIYELLPKEYHWYYYVGRLDKDSCWLVLLTNKTKLVNEMAHPTNEIEKKYLVELNAGITKKEFHKIKQGIEDEWEVLNVKSLENIGRNRKFIITLTEWKKRHIRRIFKRIRAHIILLQRISEWEYSLWKIKEWSFKIFE